jgi:Lipopolysaccharide kinase (Kdo/WaaP) family
VPAGYRYECQGGFAAWHVRLQDQAELSALGLSPSSDGPPGLFGASDIAGRRPLEQFAIAGRRALLRRFARGGLMRYFGAGFRDPRRPFRELALAAELRARGLPTPEVLFARARLRRRRFELDLCTYRIEGAQDLSAWLTELGRGQVPFSERVQVLSALGLSLGAWQASGFEHADLTPRNFLLQRRASSAHASSAPASGARATLGQGVAPERADGLALWVLDLDKSTLGAPLVYAQRVALLWRLWRHILRRPGLCSSLTRCDRARFLRGYAQGFAQRQAQLNGAPGRPNAAREFEVLWPSSISAQSVGNPDPWTHWWSAVQLRQRRSQALHRLGWWFEALLKRSPKDLK